MVVTACHRSRPVRRLGVRTRRGFPVDSPFGGFPQALPCPHLGMRRRRPRRALAQLAEHRSPKPKVGGSSPSCPARRQHMTASATPDEERRRTCRTARRSAVRASVRDPRSAPASATFYRQVVAELRKVVWPTQEQLVTYFIVVMVFVLVDDGDRVGARPGASASSSSRSSPAERPSSHAIQRRRRPASSTTRVSSTHDVSMEHRGRVDVEQDRRPPSRARRARPSRRRSTPSRRAPRSADAADAEETDERPDDEADDEPSSDGRRRARRRVDDEPTPRSPRPRPTTSERRRRGRRDEDADEDDRGELRGRPARGVPRASCGPSRVTGSWCTPTPAWRTG